MAGLDFRCMMAQHRKMLESGCGGSKLGPMVTSPDDQLHHDENTDTHTALLVRRSSTVLVFPLFNVSSVCMLCVLKKLTKKDYFWFDVLGVREIDKKLHH